MGDIGSHRREKMSETIIWRGRSLQSKTRFHERPLALCPWFGAQLLPIEI